MVARAREKGVLLFAFGPDASGGDASRRHARAVRAGGRRAGGGRGGIMSKMRRTSSSRAPSAARLRGIIELPFDPKEVFGKVRAPVKVTLNGYTFRTTIAAMGGPPCIGIRTSYREAAGLEGGEKVEVRVDARRLKRVT
jgi:hypothetical protein